MEEDISNIEEPQIDDLQIDEPPIIEEDDTHSTIGLEEDSTNTPIIPPSVSAQETTNANEDLYNPQSPTEKNVVDEDEKELGSGDCRSECKYNTGAPWKSSDYGYSD